MPKSVKEVQQIYKESLDEIQGFQKNEKDFFETVKNYALFYNKVTSNSKNKDAILKIKPEIESKQKQLIRFKEIKQTLEQYKDYVVFNCDYERIFCFTGKNDLSNIIKFLKKDKYKIYFGESEDKISGKKDLKYNSGKKEYTLTYQDSLFLIALKGSKMEIEVKYDGHTYKQKNEVESAIKALNKDILEFNDDITKLREQKALLKQTVSILPNPSFALKTITSEKSDTTKCLEKLSRLSKLIDGIFPKTSDKIFNRLSKLKTRFQNLNIFFNGHCEKIKQITQLKPEVDSEKISIITNEIKKEEQTFSFAFIQDLQKLFNDIQTEVSVPAKSSMSALTTSNSSLPDGSYTLKTPFGKVDVGINKNEILIYPKRKNVTPTYDVLSSRLDSISARDLVISVADEILKYLKFEPKIKDKLIGQNLLNLVNPQKFKGILNSQQKEAAAILCGILLLSESHESRNPTYGKLEKNAIKNIKKLALEGCINPFSKVLSNKTGRYVPAHDSTSDGNISGIDTIAGGKNQASLLLSSKLLLGATLIQNEIAIKIEYFPTYFKDTPTTLFRNKSKTITPEELKAIGSILKIEDLEKSVLKEKFESWEYGDIKIIEEILKNATVKGNSDLYEMFQLRKFQLQIQTLKDGEYIKINKLPNDPAIDKFNFGSGIQKTPKDFFEYQLNKNLRKTFKLQSRTSTKEVIEKILK